MVTILTILVAHFSSGTNYDCILNPFAVMEPAMLAPKK